MRTVAQITEELIKESPFLEEALGNGVINLTGLARKLKPKIEAVSLKKTGSGAIVMALQRLAVKLRKKKFGKSKILAPKDLLLRSNIVEYVFELSASFNKLLSQLVAKVENIKDGYITTAQGAGEATIFINQGAASLVEKLFYNQKLLFKLEKQSIIILRFSHNTIQMPGVYYNVLKALAWEGVPINEVVSVGNELTLIFEQQHIDKAFSVIKQLVDK